ncbi:hypothetical protein M9H77_12225 [Catharanthus roseus]|uniref:Uncharacterized protein n=1 Tax=Catharanthus roseus TaxID=4058 RepID=A0ACC0BGX2_CATRO|nr:hypothetical protein M9H77_12225 [Catharanthus roseus]
MVRLGAHSDDDLGAVIDRTARVERRAVTASSRGMRGRHSTLDIPSTSAPIAPDITPIPFTTHPSPTTSYHPYTPVPYDPYGYSQPPQTSYDPYAHAPSLPIRMLGLDLTQHFSRTQIPLNDVSGPGLQLGAQFFEQLAGSVPVDSSYSGAEYGATPRGISSSDAGLGRDSGTSRSEEAGRVGYLRIHSSEDNEDKREDDDDYDNSDDDDDDHEPVPVVEASSSGHRPAPGILKSRSRYMSLTNWTPSDPTVVQLAGETGLSHLRSCMFQHPNYSYDLDISDSSIGINAQELAGVADSPRSGLSMEQRAVCYVLYLLGSSVFTDKNENNVPGKLWPLVKNVSSVGLDIHVFSYVCTSGESGSEVVQTLHPEVCRVGVFRQFGWVQCIPAHPIRPQEYLRPANKRVYIVKNVFIEALWLNAPSHLLTSTWTSIPAIPPSRCTDDYMPWLPRGVQMPTIAPITPHALLNMVARELDRDDIDDATNVSRASDMIKRYHHTPR